MDYINLSEIVQFLKAPIIVISAQLKMSALSVVSHVLSAKVSPELSQTQFSGPSKRVPFP